MVDRSDIGRLTDGERFLATFNYGNWTGPSYGGRLYWTAGEFFTSDVIDTVPPVDSFDGLSRWHDIAYDNAQMRQAIDLALGVDPGLAKALFAASILHSDRVFLAQLPYHHVANSVDTTSYRQLAYNAFQMQSIKYRDIVRRFHKRRDEAGTDTETPAHRTEAERIPAVFENSGNDPEYEAQPFMNVALYRDMLQRYTDPAEGAIVDDTGRFAAIPEAELRQVIDGVGGLKPTDPVPWHADVRQQRQDTFFVGDLSDDAQRLYHDRAGIDPPDPWDDPDRGP